jgi:hypothetical protein
MQLKEYGFTIKKVGICPKCGRRASRSKKFYQPLTLFNRNYDGTVKTLSDILNECCSGSGAWAKEPVYHLKCE